MNRFEAARQRRVREDEELRAHSEGVKKLWRADVEEQHRKAALRRQQVPSATNLDQICSHDDVILVREFLAFMGDSTGNNVGTGLTLWKVGRTTPKSAFRRNDEGVLCLCNDETFREQTSSGLSQLRETHQAEFGQYFVRDLGTYSHPDPDGPGGPVHATETVFHHMDLETVLRRLSQAPPSHPGR